MSGIDLPVLRTARLVLRGLEPRDTDAVLRIFADPRQSRFFQADFSDPARCREMVERRLAYSGPAGLGHWVVEFEGEVVGLAHLRPSNAVPAGSAELGYFLRPDHSGKGLATEAASALLRHGLWPAGLSAVWALIHESNVASRTVAERLGFRDMGGETHYGGPHRVYVALPTVMAPAPAAPGMTPPSDTETPAPHGLLHHVELWVPDLARAEKSLGWLLGRLGWSEFQRWPDGVSWRLGATYVVAECSPALTSREHDRCRPGLNHLALHVATEALVDELAADAQDHGWRHLFEEKYPHAGGTEHYAAYLENEDGFEAELVAVRPGFTLVG